MSDATLQGLWTKYGRDRLADWISGGPPVRFAQVAVGGGGGSIPAVDPLQTALVEETWRGAVNNVLLNPDDATDVVVDTVIPNDIGGFWIREWGIFDEHDKLVAVGPHDEMHKPKIESGQAVEFLLRLHLPVSNSASVVITIADHALASRDYVASYVGKQLDDHNADPDAHPALPSATMATRGLVRLATYEEAIQGRRNDVAVTPVSLPAPPGVATEERRGLVRLATYEEAVAGEALDVAMTPKGVVNLLTGNSAGGLTEQGWQRLPGGLIMQWGSFNRSGIQPYQGFRFPFPIAFPHACFFAIATGINADGKQTRKSHMQIWDVSPTKLGVYCQGFDGGPWPPETNLNGCFWLAVGY